MPNHHRVIGFDVAFAPRNCCEQRSFSRPLPVSSSTSSSVHLPKMDCEDAATEQPPGKKAQRKQVAVKLEHRCAGRKHKKLLQDAERGCRERGRTLRGVSRFLAVVGGIATSLLGRCQSCLCVFLNEDGEVERARRRGKNPAISSSSPTDPRGAAEIR